MGLYGRVILPRLLHLAMQNRQATRWRQQVVPGAWGRVVELGLGSGLNLPFYGADVEAVFGIEPCEALLRRARAAASSLPFRLELLARSAEQIPLEDSSIDCVVSTWTLCTIPDAPRALAEVRRLLKPTGRLLLVEHGRAPEPAVRAWQRRLDPLWTRCAGGCHLDRPIDALVRCAGLAFERLETGYLVRGPRVLTYHYVGRARLC